MPEGISYDEWKALANSSESTDRADSISVHVTLYDAQGRPQTIRGEMVARKMESGVFFAEDPTEEDAEEVEPEPEPKKKGLFH